MKKLIPSESITKIEFVNKNTQVRKEIVFESDIPEDMPTNKYWKPYHALIQQFGSSKHMEQVKFAFEFVDEFERQNPEDKDKYLEVYFELDTWYTPPSTLIEMVRDIFKTCPIVNREDMFYAYVTRTLDSFYEDYNNLNDIDFNKKYYD